LKAGGEWGLGRRVESSREKKQAVLVVGYPGAGIRDEDRYALELLQEACSDMGSRLFMRVREKLGLAYFVGAQNLVGLVPGFFAFYAGTAPEQVAAVERELAAEAVLLAREGLGAEELARVKAKVLGQRKIGRQDLGNYATATALDELYGLGYGYADAEDARYEAVTEEQVRTAACRHLAAGREAVVWVMGGEDGD
jgi:zinc protease